MVKFAKHSRTTVRLEGANQHRKVIFTSFAGTVDYDEKMPSFHDAGWASWCAFRLLHPNALCDFEREIRALFEDYKKGGRKWITYNEEKRAVLQRYLSLPYEPKGKRK